MNRVHILYLFNKTNTYVTFVCVRGYPFILCVFSHKKILSYVYVQ